VGTLIFLIPSVPQQNRDFRPISLWQPTNSGRHRLRFVCAERFVTRSFYGRMFRDNGVSLHSVNCESDYKMACLCWRDHMQYEIEPYDLVLKLVSAINAANIDWNNSTLWTRKVKAALRDILQRGPTEVIFSEPERDVSEFMLDIIAWSRDDGEGIVLAVESEWDYKPAEVRKDFEKLLVIKSALKLMIFASTRGRIPWQRRIFEELRASLLLYKHHIKGERYIFVDFAPLPDRMAFWIEVNQDGRMVSIPQPRQVDLGHANDWAAAALLTFCADESRE